jgi:hypothetical protein
MPFGSSELPLNYHPAAIIVSTAFALRPKFGSSAGGSFPALSRQWAGCAIVIQQGLCPIAP